MNHKGQWSAPPNYYQAKSIHQLHTECPKYEGHNIQKAPKHECKMYVRMSVASCLWELFIILLSSNMRILSSARRFRNCGWGWWLVALGDVAVHPQHCAALLRLESCGRKSFINSSFHIQGDFWSRVDELKVAWTQTFLLSESCRSVLCFQEPGCHLNEFCTSPL